MYVQGKQMNINKDTNIRLAINSIDEAIRYLMKTDDDKVNDALADLSDASWKLREIRNRS
jgi:hypothetical protein